MKKEQKNDWKERLNIVYSTNPDYTYQEAEHPTQQEVEKTKQNLRILLDKKNRGGKVVTLVRGFAGSEEALKELGKLLKTKCGVGGAIKEGEIIIQGDFKTKVVELLHKEGYTKTKSI